MLLPKYSFGYNSPNEMFSDITNCLWRASQMPYNEKSKHSRCFIQTYIFPIFFYRVPSLLSHLRGSVIVAPMFPVFSSPRLLVASTTLLAVKSALAYRFSMKDVTDLVVNTRGANRAPLRGIGVRGLICNKREYFDFPLWELGGPS